MFPIALASFKKNGRFKRAPRSFAVRLLWHGALFLLLFFIGTLWFFSPQVAFLERQIAGVQMSVYHRCYNARADAARRRIVLVPITDDTFSAPSFQSLKAPPLPRNYHVRIIRELQKAGAAVIVFDLLFDRKNPQDYAFAKAAKKFKNIIWAASWQEGNANSGQWAYPNSILRGASPYIGHTRTPHTAIDPATDQIELLANSNSNSASKALPALSLQAMRLGAGLGEFSLKRAVTGVELGPFHLPVGSDGAFKIMYSGAAGQGFQSVPYAKIYSGLDRNPKLKALLKDKIIFIGDATEINRDFGYTPFGRMSGMEIHAHATATLIQRCFVADADPKTNTTILAVLLFLAWAVAGCLSLRRVLLAGVLLLSAFFVGSTWLFVEQSVDIAVAMPLIMAILMMVGVVIERGGTEEGVRRRMSAVLEQYVSPQVAQEGAPQGEVTLVFTDIEGSSMLSERHGAAFEKVRDEHFQLLRGAARRWNGFEVETAGDSLFVAFADAADAVRFAVDGQMALVHHSWPPLLLTDARAADAEVAPGPLGDALPVRIGMHTGTPFIGRDRTRLTYRGPVTNRASRVMGSGHGGQILLSQATWEKAHEALQRDEKYARIHFIERGAYHLKGVGADKLWEVCHPDLFEPPPRPLRDVAIEEAS